MIKKFFLTVVAGIIFILLLAVVIGGFNNSNVNNTDKNENTDEDLSKYSVDPSDIVFDKSNGGGENIKVYLTKEKKMITLSLEEYVRGVVCGEMPAEYNIEALKAQAVAARTFAMAHMEVYGGKKYSKAKGADVTDDINCQVYMDKNKRLNSWNKKYEGKYWNKITEAVQATEGQVLKYNGKLVMEPYYFAVSSGRTEDSVQVFGDSEPYLKSVVSSGEEDAPKYKTETKISYGTFIDEIKGVYKDLDINYFNLKSKIKIVSRTSSGAVKEVKIGNETITGNKFRNILQLNSANFNIKFHLTYIEIECIGYGHNVGMSQYGANVMAKNGKQYKDILTYYYQGVSVEKIK